MTDVGVCFNWQHLLRPCTLVMPAEAEKSGMATAEPVNVWSVKVHNL